MSRTFAARLTQGILAVLLAFAPTTACLARPVTLKLFNWPDYIAPEVLLAFEKTHHIKVEVVAFESDELKDELLLNTHGGEGLDIIVSARHSMVRLINQQWVMPLDNTRLPNRQNLNPRFDAPRNNVHEHAIPYLWGTMGIAWRSDKISKPFTSWKEFFNPAEPLKGHIMTNNDSQDAIGLALKAAGHSLNETSPDALAQAKTLLKTQQPFVKKYAYPALDETSELLGNDIWAAMMFNGDALTLKSINPAIEYKVPREGGIIWADYMGILTKSKHPQEAHQFLNYLCDAQVAANNSVALNFAPANTQAEKLLPTDFLANQAIFPPGKLLLRSEQFQDLTPQQQKQRTDMFLEISN